MKFAILTTCRGRFGGSKHTDTPVQPSPPSFSTDSVDHPKLDSLLLDISSPVSAPLAPGNHRSAFYLSEPASGKWNQTIRALCDWLISLHNKSNYESQCLQVHVCCKMSQNFLPIKNWITSRCIYIPFCVSSRTPVCSHLLAVVNNAAMLN